MQNSRSPVTLSDDGDIVRALGLVTMYFAHLEQVLNDCLDQASTHHGYQRLPGNYLGFERRRRHLRSFVNGCEGDASHLRLADSFLRSCWHCARLRNRLVHGPIVSNPGRKTVELIESGDSRKAVTLNSARIYKIAQDIRDVTRAGRQVRQLIVRSLSYDG